MKVLASHKKNKKKKYLAPCLAQHFHFTPFIVSADGLLIGHEADAMVCQLASKYVGKLRNLIQCFVALCAITLAWPFFMPLTAVFDSHIPFGCMS